VLLKMIGSEYSFVYGKSNYNGVLFLSTKLLNQEISIFHNMIIDYFCLIKQNTVFSNFV